MKLWAISIRNRVRLLVLMIIVLVTPIGLAINQVSRYYDYPVYTSTVVALPICWIVVEIVVRILFEKGK